MATEAFSVMHAVSKTVYFRFMDLANNKIFDFDDDVWEANLAAATTPKLAATENSDLGDATNAVYRATANAANFNASSTPMRILIQAVDDLATDIIIQTTEVLIVNGQILSITDIATGVWASATRSLTDKVGFALSAAGILAIWHQLASAIVTAGTIGKLLVDNINATIASRSSHTAAAAGTDAAAKVLATPANLLETDTGGEVSLKVATQLQIDQTDANAASVQARLTAARAGYLDNLNVAGIVPTQAEVLAIQNNTRIRVVVPSEMQIPGSGNTLYLLEIFLYDSQGAMEAPDSLPTIAAANHLGTDRSSNLGTVTLVSTGHYKVTYDVAAAHAVEPVTVIWSIVEDGETRKHAGITHVSNVTAAMGFNSSDRTNLNSVNTNVDVAVSTRSSHSAADAGTDAALKILATPANLLTTDGAGAVSLLAATQTTLDAAATEASLVKVQNSLFVLPAAPAEMPIPMAGSTLFQLDLFIHDHAGNMEAPDSTPLITCKNEGGTDRSSGLGTVQLVSAGRYSVTYEVAAAHAQEQIRFAWLVVEGGVTLYYGVSTQVTSMAATSVAAIWAALTSGLTVPGSVGKLIVDNLDAKVSLGGSELSVLVGPLVGTNNPGNRTTVPVPLSMFQHEEISFALLVKDSTGAAVDLSARTLRFVVYDTTWPATGVFDVEDVDITITGTENNIANVKVTAVQAAVALRDLRWVLWDGIDAQRSALLNGTLRIRGAVENVA